MCRLEGIAGRERRCGEADCPFWEPGGAVLEGRCTFERVDLDAWPVLAAGLLGIRGQLDTAAVEARTPRLSRLPD